MNKTNLNESVLDPIHKTRCRKIFDNNDIMLPAVKKQIVDNFEDWKSKCGKDFKVMHIYQIGSSSGFQYTDTSDIDVSVVTDLDEPTRQELVATLPNGKLVDGTQMPINYYFNSPGNPFNLKNAENCYDVLNGTWIKKVPSSKLVIPYSYLLELAKFFMNSLDLTFSQLERDKQEYLQDKALDPNEVDISEKEKKEAMDKKIVDIKADLDSLRMGNHVIRGFLHEVYYENGESAVPPFQLTITMPTVDDPRLSVNNLVYKILEKYGYRERIDKTIADTNALLDATQADMNKKDDDKNRVTESVIIKDSSKNKLNEKYTDSELKTILENNEYLPSDNNLKILKDGLEKNKYAFYDLENATDDLNENITNKYEKKVNKAIVKTVGGGTGKSLLTLAGANLLAPGLPGLIIWGTISDEHSKDFPQKERQLYDDVQNDESASKILSSIKAELKKDSPDKTALNNYVKSFSKRLKEIRASEKESEKEDNSESTTAPKISLKEAINNSADADLKEILQDYGYADSDTNVAILRNNPKKLFGDKNHD